MTANTDTIPSPRKQLRRRRSRLLEPEEATQAPQQEQQQVEEDTPHQQPENVHCRGTEDGVSESGWEPVISELSLESIATEDYLLGPLLNASGVDFCADEPVDKFQYQHFRQVPTQANSTTQWEVNCCIAPQEQNMTYFEGIPDYYNYAVGQMFVSSWAAFFSLATILAMTLPLFKKRRRSRASTYNLYLVFLAIPDLAYNLFLLYLFARYQKYILPIADNNLPWIDHPYDLALFVSCAAANLYMNAIIASEILKLLRNSKRRKRSKAPTLKRASIQAICTYVIGGTIFVVDFFGESLKAIPIWIIGTIYYVLAIGIPISYLLWVCFRIYWESLLGDVRTKAGKRLTVLMRYFTRIIVVYICIWLPASIIYISQFNGSVKKGLNYYVACVLYAMAAWANFALSLTKPDVRKNFINLFTGQVCLPDPPEERKKPRTFDSNSNGGKSKEDQRTTSTGEESLGVKPPEPDADADPETAEVSPTPSPSTSPAKDKDAIPKDSDHLKKANGSERHGKKKEYDDDSSDDGNVFDFDGADAPVMRIAKGNNVSMMAIFAERARRFTPTGRFTGFAQRRPHQSVSSATDERHLRSDGSLDNLQQSRSSVLYSSYSTSRLSMSKDRSSMSEPFELPSTMSPEKSRRSVSTRPSWLSNFSRDSSDDPSKSSTSKSSTSKSSSATGDLEASEPKKPPSAIFEEPSSRSSDDGDPPLVPSQKTTTTASSRETIVSYRTATLDFFMDQDESEMELSDPSAVKNACPKARNRWIKELRKNIRDLGRLMKKPGVTEKEKSIYHQSMVLKMRALEVMSVSLASDTQSNTSLFGASLSDDEDDSGFLTTIPSEGAGRFSDASSISDELDVTDGYESDGSDLRLQNVQHLSERKSVDVNTSQRYSKFRWLEELRQNITDLEHRLEMEDLTEEERSLVNRAIESQKLTLASIENIGKGKGSVFIARPSAAAARLSADSANSKPKSVEHGNNSAFVRSSLEVIDDDSSVGEDAEC